MALYKHADIHLPQPLHREYSMNTGSPGSIFMIARVLHIERASQGSQDWQSVQSTSGRNKSSSPLDRLISL
jgi:hypothetical protein